MPETRFTEFPALSVDPTVGIFSVCIEDRCLSIFLTYDIKSCYSYPSFLSFLIFYVA